MFRSEIRLSMQLFYYLMNIKQLWSFYYSNQLLKIKNKKYIILYCITLCILNQIDQTIVLISAFFFLQKNSLRIEWISYNSPPLWKTIYLRNERELVLQI